VVALYDLGDRSGCENSGMATSLDRFGGVFDSVFREQMAHDIADANAGLQTGYHWLLGPDEKRAEYDRIYREVYDKVLASNVTPTEYYNALGKRLKDEED
jgi:hypothetical protein